MRPIRSAIAASLALALTTIGFVATPAAVADPRPIAARVLWWRGDRVYAASLDSTAVAPGTRLTILDGKKAIATAEVSDLFERAIIAARLTSGSLARVKKLERLRVLAEAPATLVPARLRVGYPSAARATPFFACDRVSLGGPPRDVYRVADSTAGALLLVRRDAAATAPGAWPDTLLARLFDDVADEEIALERGEIDAGIFWPGEASPHIREATRWSGVPAGVRARGVVTIGAGSDSVALDSLARSAALHADFAALDREYFRGDLLPLLASPSSREPGPEASSRIWYRVRDPRGSAIQLFLNRFTSVSAWAGRRVADVAYEDDPPDSGDTPFRRRVFAIRCPVIASPDRRAAIDAVGPDALVNLFDCVPDGRR